MALSDRLLQNTPTSLPGNLNKAELFALARAKNKKEQEDLSDPMLRNAIPLMSTAKGQFGGSFRELINRLIDMGIPREEVLKIIQSRMDAMTAEPLMSTAEGHFSGSPHSEGPFWNQYNQGGIVSLRHLTRPIGI